MSTHNICFRGEIRKISTLLDWKKHLSKSYECVLLLFIPQLFFLGAFGRLCFVIVAFLG